MGNVHLPEDVRRVFQRFGRQGGAKTKARLGSPHYSRIGKLGMATRWGTKRQNANLSVEGLKTMPREHGGHDGGARRRRNV